MRLKTTLIEHQQNAVTKLKGLKVGGLLMEMGTGKTRALIELAYLRRSRIDKTVVFCPVALKQTWLYELHKHIENPSVYVFDDKTQQGNIPAVEWYLIGVESMSQSDRVVLAANELITDQTFVVLDESDTCKNHRAIRTQRITAISQRAAYRMVLTGTAVGEGVEDRWFRRAEFLLVDHLVAPEKSGIRQPVSCRPDLEAEAL